jgi:hypothetical protein
MKHCATYRHSGYHFYATHPLFTFVRLMIRFGTQISYHISVIQNKSERPRSTNTEAARNGEASIRSQG